NSLTKNSPGVPVHVDHGGWQAVTTGTIVDHEGHVLAKGLTGFLRRDSVGRATLVGAGQDYGSAQGAQHFQDNQMRRDAQANGPVGTDPSAYLEWHSTGLFRLTVEDQRHRARPTPSCQPLTHDAHRGRPF